MTTLETIQTVMQDTLDIAPEDVTMETTLEALELDSLDLTELLSNLEEELDVEFGEPEGIETIGDLVEYIDNL